MAASRRARRLASPVCSGLSHSPNSHPIVEPSIIVVITSGGRRPAASVAVLYVRSARLVRETPVHASLARRLDQALSFRLVHTPASVILVAFLACGLATLLAPRRERFRQDPIQLRQVKGVPWP